MLELESTIVDGTERFAGNNIKDEDMQLRFENVTYQFPAAERPVLQGLDFEMKKGQTLAIIGGTGSGKSTVANLIMRFYDASQGAVYLNGKNLRNLTQHDVRERVSYVPQKANLFSGTIRSNMLDGKENATDEEIWRALEIAQAKPFVEGLEDGLDHVVEQGGTNFSGGQRQRLCIARAIIKEPAVYVFDDSFSALDFKTDAALRKALLTEITDAIIVIVAQRISTVRDADLIVVLENGKVVGQGTHNQLVAEDNETYMEIMNSQFREGEGR